MNETNATILKYAKEEEANPIYREVEKRLIENGRISAYLEHDKLVKQAKAQEQSEFMAMYASGQLKEPEYNADENDAEPWGIAGQAPNDGAAKGIAGRFPNDGEVYANARHAVEVTPVTPKNILPRQEMKSAVTAVTSAEKEPVFWLENKSGKLGIVLSEFVNWLEFKGFRQYNPEGESYSLVRVVGHIIEPFSSSMLANNLRSILFEGRAGMDMADSSHTWSEIYAALVNSVGSVLEANRLSMIKSLERPPLRDTRSRCYFPFRNCLVRVSVPPNTGKTPDNQAQTGWSIDLCPYEKSQYLFYKDEIIDRNFSFIGERAANTCMFADFLSDTCMVKDAA